MVFFVYFWLEDNCFTMLCWLLQQHESVIIVCIYTYIYTYIYICVCIYIHTFPLPLELLSHSHPSNPTPLGHHWAEIPVLHSNLPLASYFTHGNVYISMLLRVCTFNPTLNFLVLEPWHPRGSVFGRKGLVAQSCPTLCDPRDCGLPGSSVHGIL